MAAGFRISQGHHGHHVQLSSLAADVLFEVVDHLSVLDVLRFRQVCRSFERLSRNAAVWKRLLRRLNLPLPHLPCTISALSAAQAERLIRRAISVDRHWAPRPRALGVALDSYDKPYIIKFAPGGRYIVAATKNMLDDVYGVVIWDLETPGTPTALVRYQTRTLLSTLLVKWVPWQGDHGLAVIMLRLLDGTKAIKKTEVHVIHISLDNLHRLSANQGIHASPFKPIQTHKTHCQIAQVGLEDHVLLLTHRPRTLMFINLLTKETCKIKLRNAIPEYRHSIWGARILPYQNQVLVVRLIYRDTDYFTAFEIFDIPAWGASAKEPPPVQQQVFESPSTSSVVVSEMSTIQPATDYPTHDEMLENNFYAAPISIVAHIAQPRGFIHWIIQPELLPDPRTIAQTAPANPVDGMIPELSIPPNPLTRMVSRPTLTSRSSSDGGIPSESDDALIPMYSLPATKVATFQFEEADQKTSAIPGLSRMLLWTRPAESRADSPPMLNLFAYRVVQQVLWTPGPGYLAYQAAQAQAQVQVQAQAQLQVQVQAQAPANVSANGAAETFAAHPSGAVSNAMPIHGGNPAGVGTGEPNPPSPLPVGPPPTALPAPLPALPAGKLSGRLVSLQMPRDFIEAVQLSTQSVAFDESSGKIGIVAGKGQFLFLLDTGAF